MKKLTKILIVSLVFSAFAAFNAQAAGPNLLTNADFSYKDQSHSWEAGSGWMWNPNNSEGNGSFAFTDEGRPGGSGYSFKVTSDGDADWLGLAQNVTVSPGMVLKWSAWIKTEGDIFGPFFYSWNTAWEGNQASNYDFRGDYAGTRDWYEMTFIVTIPDGMTEMPFNLVTGGNGTTWYADVSLAEYDPADDEIVPPVAEVEPEDIPPVDTTPATETETPVETETPAQETTNTGGAAVTNPVTGDAPTIMFAFSGLMAGFGGIAVMKNRKKK